MSYAFLYGSVGLWVSYAVDDQGGMGLEGGVRVELRTIRELPGHRPSAEGFIFPVLKESGIWRADLLVQIEPLTHQGHHHHHPNFELGDVGQRAFEKEIGEDPISWTVAKIEHLDALIAEVGDRMLSEVGREAVLAGLDMDEVRRTLPAVRAAIAECYSRIPEKVA